jgi:hypothetical protein
MEHAPVCRFCLDSVQTKKNPFVEPCKCKGTQKYVHEKCLSRWRRMDPGKNETRCLLCLSPYTLAIGELREHVPNESTVLLFFLRYPVGLCVVVNYTALVHTIIMKPIVSVPDLFETYQYLFQILYGVLFAWGWKVRHPQEYWQIHHHKMNFFLFGFQMFCNYYLYHHEFMAVPLLVMILSMYWVEHVRILRVLNLRD